MNREVSEEFLASFPFADTTRDTYRRVLGKLSEYGDQLENWRAADLLRFVSKPDWGSSQRYTAQYISEWIAVHVVAPGLSRKIRGGHCE